MDGIKLLDIDRRTSGVLGGEGNVKLEGDELDRAMAILLPIDRGWPLLLLLDKEDFGGKP